MATGLYGSDTEQNFARVAVAEIIGTTLLVAIGTSVAVSAALKQSIAGEPANSLTVAFAFGLTLAGLVLAFGHISGAHFNPALTIAMAATKKIKWGYAIGYILSQLIGATLASGLVSYMYGEAGRSIAKLGAVAPVGIDIFHLIAIEAVATFILVICVVPFATDDRASKAASGTTVGFALTVAILFAGPLTGGAINPARAIGPMIVLWDFDDILGYVAGPIIGAVAAAFIYDKFLVKAEKPDSAE